MQPSKPKRPRSTGRGCLSERNLRRANTAQEPRWYARDSRGPVSQERIPPLQEEPEVDYEQEEEPEDLNAETSTEADQEIPPFDLPPREMPFWTQGPYRDTLELRAVLS